MPVLYKELVGLRNNILRLGLLVETAIQNSVKSVVERISCIAKKVIKKVSELYPGRSGSAMYQNISNVLPIMQPISQRWLFICAKGNW